MGYAGGTTARPTYRMIGDHTETLQLEYDPAIVSFVDLLHVFLDEHDPTRPPWSRQYMSIVFCHDESQRLQATEVLARYERRTGRAVHTRIEGPPGFTLAEGYHQKYYLQATRPLMQEMQRSYPDLASIVDSTAAARLNGIMGGFATRRDAEAVMGMLGLSVEGEAWLRRYLDRRP